MKLLGIAFALALFFACDLQTVTCHGFSYTGETGPEYWGKEYSTCNGKHQSPININLVDLLPRTFPPIELTYFDKVPRAAELINNGHTVMVKLKYANGEPTISGGPLQSKGIYALAQFHFHWGENNTVGSEDRINNVQFPAELHMVFRNTKYASFEEAALKNDGITVMAFFYSLQEYDNPNYAEFCDLLERITKPQMTVDFKHPPTLRQLISEDTQNYFTYTGSLTTPPCSEDVTWIDFAEPILISNKQIDRFRRLYTENGKPLIDNFRPIQPLNNRIIYKAITFNFEKKTDLNKASGAKRAGGMEHSHYAAVVVGAVTFMAMRWRLFLQ